MHNTDCGRGLTLGMTDQFFQIWTCHGGVLAADGAAGTVVGCAPALLSDDRPALILYRSAASPSHCFVFTMTNSLRPIRLAPEPDANSVLALRAEDAPFPQPVRLLRPASGFWICAAPGPPDGTAPIVADKRIAQAWELFTLRPLDPATVSALIWHLSQEIEWLLGANDSYTGVVERLGHAGFVDALDAVCQILPRDRLRVLASVLAGNTHAVAVLTAAAPGDLFATAGLPALAASRFGSRPENITQLGSEFDSLSTLGFDGRPTSLAHRLTIILREDSRPTKNVCILATARNEGLYLLDWLAYHRAIGVSDVFLYTNDNDDGSDALLAALDSAGVIRWRSSIVAVGGNAQQKAYGHGLQILPEILDYKWALVIDLDEFFGFNKTLFNGIGDFLDWQSIYEVDAVAINWMVHGTAGQSRWQDAFVAERFPVVQHPPDMHIKCAIRPNRFIHSRPHHPIAPYRAERIFKAATGGPYIPAPDQNELSLTLQPTADKAWISHFFYKSTEEFMLKWSRNRGDYPTSAGASNLVISEHLVRTFMAQYAITSPDNYSIRPCAPSFYAEIEHLKQLAGVRQAFEAVITRHKQRMPAIERLFRTAPGVIDAGDV